MSSQKHWIRNLFLPNLLAGAIVLTLSIFWNDSISGRKQLSYSVDGPITYFDTGSVGILNLKVNDVATDALVGYRVRIWNSGSTPLKDIPIRFIFDSGKEDFHVFQSMHATKPAEEFGLIHEESVDSRTLRVHYALLNPKDEDTITFLMNDSAALGLYTKSEGMKVKEVNPSNSKGPVSWALAGILTSFIVTVTSELVNRRRYAALKQKNKTLTDALDFMTQHYG